MSPARVPKLMAALPPISDQCTRPTTLEGRWVVFKGPVPVYLQLRLPGATVWRRHPTKKCWTRHDLLLRPTGKTALKLAAKGAKPVKGRINVGGKKLKVWLDHDHKGFRLNLSVGDDSVGEHTHKNTVDWVLPKPDGMSEGDGMDDAPICVGSAKGRLEVEALRGDAVIWFWIRCESKDRSERVLLRYDPDRRDLQPLYDERRWSFDHEPGCDMCVSNISQTIRRSWLDYSHALVYRDDAMIGTGANNTCEAHCGDVCGRKGPTCEKKCEQKAKRENARMVRRCKRIKRKLRRWELFRWDEETEQTTRAVLQRLR